MSKVWQGTVMYGSRCVVPASGVEPGHVLCAVGVGLDADALSAAIEEAGEGEFRLAELRQRPDPRMRAAFDAALDARRSTLDDEFTEDDWAAVDAHDSAAYVLSPLTSQFTALDISERALAVTAALLNCGATAVKNESSGVTCGRERWLDLAEMAEAAEDEHDLATVLRRAWVVPALPSRRDGVLYSRGMHLLGEADVELAPGRGHAEELEVRDEWLLTMDAVAHYLLTEQPEQGIQDGEGFRVSPDAPRWVMHRLECERYSSESFAFNPYGYWRLTPG
ncbi:hypothetical protein ABT301_19440 [Streptomyces sp. NPDC000987]|uniref:hypothetical protein n=1 Tax=Streptomyces sp. NPDC000987 TaxID=3154374 RepID=UPI00331CBD05